LVNYYTQVEKVMTSSTSSDALVRSTIDSGSGSSAEHQQNISRTLSVNATFLLAFRQLS